MPLKVEVKFENPRVLLFKDFLTYKQRQYFMNDTAYYVSNPHTFLV